ncbi:ThuA domain-containing protein [Olivibacter sitiensis]|uniref:ThuA domain-containing protein n=1 Tax=Olivibacter sitiensis TaxID=376470 RepID=UPI000566D1EE|nr:ThuA domain-containing protein [Olivibacter sitiensis]
MKRTKQLLLSLVMTAITYTTCAQKRDQILVFSKTAGFRHQSIEKGIQTIRELGQKNDFEVIASEDAKLFTDDKLKKFKAILFLNTTGDLFNEQQKSAFQSYIRQGGGFMGIHAATDTEFNWPWYNQLVGAYFVNHPEVQEAKLIKTDAAHPATEHLHQVWMHTDEWYNFKSIYPEIHPLLLLDETSYSGGNNGKEHPITWYHDFDGGRSFYTGLGHTDESYDENAFQQLLLGGINYAMGRKGPRFGVAPQ